MQTQKIMKDKLLIMEDANLVLRLYMKVYDPASGGKVDQASYPTAISPRAAH